ncbi:MAG: magnesium transporter [Oscillospiraceae bacterium]|nr:magnesium transporter [Oscillospiraceae bacterium]
MKKGGKNLRDNTFVLEETINALLESKKYSTLRDVLSTMNAADVAILFEEIPEDKLPLLFRLLPKELAAETFVEMDTDNQELLIRGFSDNELKEVVDELYVDDAADIVEEMPANVVKRILKQADPETRKMINEILNYPEDSAGSIMTTEYVSLRPKMTAEEAIKRIRRTGVDKETIYTCYVTQDDRTLIGYLSIKTLILSEEDDRIEDIMDSNIIAVRTTDDQEDVARMFSKYNFMALPVVDKEDRLVGIVTVDDAIDVLTEETTEDIEKMAAITPSEKPYLKTSVIETWKARMPWLLLLMISATFTGLIITKFETALAAQVALMSFVPMLMDTAGNSGSQASVTVIRGIALQEIGFVDFFKVVLKEARVSLICGATLAVVCFGKIMLVDHLLMHNPAVTAMVAFTVAVTLVLTIVCAKLVGCMLPMLAERLKLDPAVMASPFITTIVDAVSLLIYFKVATALLGL